MFTGGLLGKERGSPLEKPNHTLWPFPWPPEGPLPRHTSPKQDPSLRRMEEDTPPQKPPGLCLPGGGRAAQGAGSYSHFRAGVRVGGMRVGGVRLEVGGGWGRGRWLLTEETAQASSVCRSDPHPACSPSLGLVRPLL